MGYARTASEKTVLGKIITTGLCLCAILALGADPLARAGAPGRILLPESIRVDSIDREYDSVVLCDGVRSPVRWWESWKSAPGDKEHWVEFKFASPVHVKAVAIHWHKNKGVVWNSRNYKIQCRTKGGYVDVVEVNDNLSGSLSVHGFDEVETKKIRVWQPAGGGPAGQTNVMWISEIEVYDYAKQKKDFGSKRDQEERREVEREVRERTVGIYKRYRHSKNTQSIKTVLSKAGMRVVELDTLDERELKRCGVLVVAGVRHIPNKESVINFIANGGSALFLYNACGRSGGSLFPEVWRFIGISKSELVVKDRNHPLTKGLPDRFAHACTDHVFMEAGKEGMALLVDTDGDAVVIAGCVGDGKVVAMGNCPGLASGPDWDNVELKTDEGNEIQLLKNSIDWLAAGTPLRDEWKDSRDAGAWREKNEKQKKQFTDVTEACGMTYGWYAKGVAMADVDDDGDLDIYATLDDQPNRFYRNDGNWRFTDIAKQAGVDRPVDGIGCAFADLNGDANLDLFVCRLPEMGSVKGDRNFLYLGDGKGRFRDATEQSGLFASDPTADCVFGDVDKDGDLDLYLVNYSASNKLCLNDGKGVFRDVTSEWGLDGLGSAGSTSYGSLASALADLDGDGYQDLITFAGFDFRVLRNKEGKGFQDVTGKLGVNVPSGRCLGVTLGDLDNDGDLDVYCARLNKCLRNDGDFRFSDITIPAGFETFEKIHPYGPAFVDIDNDGDLDLFLGTGAYDSIIYLNNGDSTFSDATATIGLDVYGVHGFNFGDLDKDGDLDFYATSWDKSDFKLLRNNQDDRNYLKIRVKGRKTNSAGIGARIWVYENQGKDKNRLLRGYREVLGGGGAMYTCPPLEQHFGLPQGRKYCVEVFFPVSGKRVVLNDVEAGQRLSIEEPK